MILVRIFVLQDGVDSFRYLHLPGQSVSLGLLLQYQVLQILLSSCVLDRSLSLLAKVLVQIGLILVTSCVARVIHVWVECVGAGRAVVVSLGLSRLVCTQGDILLLITILVIVGVSVPRVIVIIIIVPRVVCVP